MKDTATVDLEIFNRALLLLQSVSGEVSFLKVLPVVNAFQQSIIPEPAVSPEHEAFIAEADDAYEKEAKEAMLHCNPSAAEELRKQAEK